MITEPTRNEMRLIFDKALSASAVESVRNMIADVMRWHEALWNEQDRMAKDQADKTGQPFASHGQMSILPEEMRNAIIKFHDSNSVAPFTPEEKLPPEAHVNGNGVNKADKSLA